MWSPGLTYRSASLVCLPRYLARFVRLPTALPILSVTHSNKSLICRLCDFACWVKLQYSYVLHFSTAMYLLLCMLKILRRLEIKKMKGNFPRLSLQKWALFPIALQHDAGKPNSLRKLVGQQRCFCGCWVPTVPTVPTRVLTVLKSPESPWLLTAVFKAMKDLENRWKLGRALESLCKLRLWYFSGFKGVLTVPVPLSHVSVSDTKSLKGVTFPDPPVLSLSCCSHFYLSPLINVSTCFDKCRFIFPCFFLFCLFVRSLKIKKLKKKMKWPLKVPGKSTSSKSCKSLVQWGNQCFLRRINKWLN